jgi:hypothetical protein
MWAPPRQLKSRLKRHRRTIEAKQRRPRRKINVKDSGRLPGIQSAVSDSAQN